MVMSTTSVVYPAVGPSVCERIFRVTPGVPLVAGGGVWAEASVAMNPVSEQSAQDATVAKSRRESLVMVISLYYFDAVHCLDRYAMTGFLAAGSAAKIARGEGPWQAASASGGV